MATSLNYNIDNFLVFVIITFMNDGDEQNKNEENHVSMGELLLGCLGGCLIIGVLIGLLLLYFWFLAENYYPGLGSHRHLRALRTLHPTQSERTLKN